MAGSWDQKSTLSLWCCNVQSHIVRIDSRQKLPGVLSILTCASRGFGKQLQNKTRTPHSCLSHFPREEEDITFCLAQGTCACGGEVTDVGPLKFRMCTSLRLNVPSWYNRYQDMDMDLPFSLKKIYQWKIIFVIWLELYSQPNSYCDSPSLL